MEKRIILSTTPIFLRIEEASKKLKIDLRNVMREYGINEKTAQMLEDMLARKSGD